METCNGLIDLCAPKRRTRERGFQPPWYTVFEYECPECHGKVRVRAGSFRGKTPVLGVGAIRCNGLGSLSTQA
jgi:hypothetical protein